MLSIFYQKTDSTISLVFFPYPASDFIHSALVGSALMSLFPNNLRNSIQIFFLGLGQLLFPYLFVLVHEQVIEKGTPRRKNSNFLTPSKLLRKLRNAFPLHFNEHPADKRFLRQTTRAVFFELQKARFKSTMRNIRTAGR